MGKEAKLENVWEIQKEKRLFVYNKIKQEQEENFLKACTFKPKTNPYHGKY